MIRHLSPGLNADRLTPCHATDKGSTIAPTSTTRTVRNHVSCAQNDDVRGMLSGRGKIRSWSTQMYSERPPPQPAMPLITQQMRQLLLHSVRKTYQEAHVRASVPVATHAWSTTFFLARQQGLDNDVQTLWEPIGVDTGANFHDCAREPKGIIISCGGIKATKRILARVPRLWEGSRQSHSGARQASGRCSSAAARDMREGQTHKLSEDGVRSLA